MFCRINSFGEFIYINGKLNPNNFYSTELIVDGEDVFKGTKLEYFQTCMEEVSDEKKALLLWLFSYYPLAEKMWKSPDYKKVVKYYVDNSSYSKFNEFLERHFGVVDVNAKTINKALGGNSYQLKKALDNLVLDSYYSRYSGFIAVKSGLCQSDISYMDNDTYDALCNFAAYMTVRSYSSKETFERIYKHYSLKGLVRVAECFNYCKENEKDVPWRDLVMLYQDYIRMVDELNDYTNFRPYFKTTNDVEEMHDAATVIYDMRYNAIKTEAFQKHSSRWKKWEYNKNEKFSVIAPVMPNDLAKEGMTLHHCVKSYIDRVANGRTNIMFIRKNENLEEPFFTVEVSNDGTIEQVHGFGNRNANTEEGLEDFVKEWADAKKLSTRSYNKIR